MAVAGVIAEYHPFHLGHAWQLQALRRRLGADTAVVAVMSGNFVQRGDFALLEKHARAEAALLGGVDLVLELPTPWAAATAEIFAQGGVALLAAAGVVTHLAFGSEGADLAALEAAAACLDAPAFQEALGEALKGGVTFAAAREAAARRLIGDAAACLRTPNDALAVEYLRSLHAQGGGLTPLALPRVGAAHDSGQLEEFASASAVRALVYEGGDWARYVPETTAEILAREMAALRAPVSMARCERAVLARLRGMAQEDFLPYDGGGEGLYRLFYAAVRACTTADDILLTAKTKRYTLARLRRMLLHSYLGLSQARRGEAPPYLRVLGATGRGRQLLREMGRAASLPVLTKPGHARRLGRAAEELLALEARCTDLYTLAYPDLAQARPGSEYRLGPVLL